MNMITIKKKSKGKVLITWQVIVGVESDDAFSHLIYPLPNP